MTLLSIVFGLSDPMYAWEEAAPIYIMLGLLGIKCSRGTSALVSFSVCLAVWGYAYSLELGPVVGFLIVVFPLWVLVTFGSFALVKVGWGVAWMPDKTEELGLLQKDIQKAKEGLAKRGFKWDK